MTRTMTRTMTKQRRTSNAVFVAAAIFGIILLVLVINGGMCERYNRKMQRQQLMRQYLDSIRAEEQKRFLNELRPTTTRRQ